MSEESRLSTQDARFKLDGSTFSALARRDHVADAAIVAIVTSERLEAS